ncbi:MAG: hypothetical protein IPK32_06860 [Verrucomicrobiaceae bacterium]|nr:hypothetical protein [Verrucomicrobiaceae bacterium]
MLNDTGTIDISPASWGNNPIGTESGTGYATNPVTGGTYTANNVPKGDFYRVLAEYWADGPHSETPPGHWHVIANQVADMPGFSKRLRGTGPVVNDLEWDVKTYMSLAGSVHDAACAAWSLKRYYSGTRPITMIRHMCMKGQSSNPSGPSYHTEGIPPKPMSSKSSPPPPQALEASIRASGASHSIATSPAQTTSAKSPSNHGQASTRIIHLLALASPRRTRAPCAGC